MFCPNCGTMLVRSEDGFVCPSCKYRIQKKNVEKTMIVNKASGKEVIMISEEKTAEPLDSDAVCPKCHETGAYFLLKQTRSADEPETKFYTCSHCGHRWREY
ncbi:MAG: transcription factor S [Candidatus Thermoplasmatota archaeon]|nr:transcription factor S [Candidatus Thermoplasmatota archaeon]MCL5731581.1 transcription factor S [Candidatus Thermoplasmatota archaeon]